MDEINKTCMEIWESMHVRQGITARFMENLVVEKIGYKLDSYMRGKISSFLSNMVRGGKATKCGIKPSTEYIKIEKAKQTEPKPTTKQINTEAVTLQQIGEAVLSAIERVKKENDELKEDLKTSIERNNKLQQEMRTLEERLIGKTVNITKL